MVSLWGWETSAWSTKFGLSSLTQLLMGSKLGRHKSKEKGADGTDGYENERESSQSNGGELV